MSWNSGSQLTLATSKSRPTEITICTTLVHTARWVISRRPGLGSSPTC